MVGTKFPRRMPISMARNIHTARNLSSQPRDLKAEVFAGHAVCFSASCAEFGELDILVRESVKVYVLKSFAFKEIG